MCFGHTLYYLNLKLFQRTTQILLSKMKKRDQLNILYVSVIFSRQKLVILTVMCPSNAGDFGMLKDGCYSCLSFTGCCSSFPYPLLPSFLPLPPFSFVLGPIQTNIYINIWIVVGMIRFEQNCIIHMFLFR